MKKVRICDFCYNEIDNKAKICPICKEKIKHPIYKKWWFYLIIVIIASIEILISNSDNLFTKHFNFSNVVNTQREVNENNFDLVGSTTSESDGYGYYIKGILKNNTSTTYTYTQITFNLYDKNGNQLGTAIANINNFEANGTWKFKAIALITDVKEIKSYKFIGVDAY